MPFTAWDLHGGAEQRGEESMERKNFSAGIPCTCRDLAHRLMLLVLLGAFLPACQSSRTAARLNQLETRSEDLLLYDDPVAAIDSFRQLAAKSKKREDKAKAYLGIARSYIKLGNYRKALDSLYTARKHYDMGPLHETSDRLFGEASFLNRDYGIARGYLVKSLPLTSGPERVRILARLSICAEKCSDRDAAARYRSKIPTPLDEEIQELFRTHLEPPRPEAPAARIAVARPSPRPQEDGISGVPLRVIPRGSWGASPVRHNVDKMGEISRITVHHTGGATFWGRSSAESARHIRNIQRVHQNVKHWADIGYHYIIDRMGRVWQGRPIYYQGAHARGGRNRGNIGVVVLGNYLHQEMTMTQYRVLRELLAALCSRYHVHPNSIYTHAEICDGTTDCPGPAISQAVQTIRRGLQTSRWAD